MLRALRVRLTGTPRSSDALQEQAIRLTRLHRFDRAVAEAESTEAIAEEAVRHIRDLIPCHHASVVTFDYEAGLAVLLASYSAAPGRRRGGSRWPLESIDVSEELKAGRVRASGGSLSVPLMGGGELIGLVSLGSTLPLAREHVETAIWMAESLASALHRASRSDALLRHALKMERRLNEMENESKHLVLAEVVRVQEQERERIAADIHDDSAQVMATSMLRLSRLREELTDPRHVQLVAGIERTIDLAITRLRRLIFELVPPAVDGQMLREMIQRYLERVRDDTDLAFRLEDRLMTEPAGETRTILYRIVQEAVTNVVKHAHAETVLVTLETRERGCLLTVEDDGKGFVLREVIDPASGHLGLTAMRQRAEMAGGWCRVESRQDVGTTVLCWVPGDPTISPAQPSDPVALEDRT